MKLSYCIYESCGAWVCEFNTGHKFWAASKDVLEREINNLKEKVYALKAENL